MKLLLFLGILACHTASAVLSLEFNDGNLPEATGDWERWGAQDGFTVSNGYLEQRTNTSNGNHSYFSPGFDDYLGGQGPFDATNQYLLEVRLEILAVSGNDGYSLYTAFSDGDYRYIMRFEENGFIYGENFLSYDSIFNSGAYPPSGAHTYRFEAQGSGTFGFYVDNNFIGTSQGVSAIFNGVEFGDGDSRSGYGGDANWDFIRVSQVSLVPEPASTASMAILLSAGAIFRRRDTESR